MSLNKVSRRDLFKWLGGVLVIPRIPMGKTVAIKNSGVHRDISPIQRDLPDVPSTGYFGDNPSKSHGLLWETVEIIKKKKTYPHENRKLVIVGGGMSGLLSAYLLKNLNPLLLEHQSRVGGNSQGQAWRGIEYSTGAAYIAYPDEDSKIYKLLNELGVFSKIKVKESDDPVEYQGKLISDFWKGKTAPDQAAQFQKLEKFFIDFYNNEEEVPEIPYYNLASKKVVDKLDAMSLREYLEKQMGAKLHPHIEKYLDFYCQSSFGGGWDEISAAAGMNFLYGEFNKTGSFPAGNAAIAESILNKLSKDTIRTDATVIHVEVKDNKVEVLYLDKEKKPKVMVADHAILSCPKFIAKRLLEGIEKSRIDAIENIEYRAYLVANVFLNKPIAPKFYDIYYLSDGTLKSREIFETTDSVHASFKTEEKDRSVLTLYHAMAFTGGRQEIYQDDSYAIIQKKFDKELESKILPALGLKKENVLGMRISRVGHPLPLSKTKQFSNGMIEELRKPFKERVFFVQQDNWLLPAFETVVGEAYHWADIIRGKK